MLHSLVSAGSNAQGQLASGDDEDQHTFSACSFLGCQPGAMPPETKRVAQIACGANHTLVLLDRAESSFGARRELWGAGDGSKQQLGPSISSSVTVFTPLDLDLAQYNLQDYSFEAVAACWETSYVVLFSPGKSDVLLSFGADDYGDLGIGGLKGKTDLLPIHLVSLDECLAASGAAIHILRIQTGLHTVIVQLQIRPDEGPAREELVGWGAARHGQLGEQRISPTSLKNVPYLDRPRPLRELVGSIPSFALGSNHTVALRSSGILLGLGSSRKGQLTFVPDIDDILAVDCTWNSTFVVVGSGRKWSILSSGASNKGQLGRDLEKAARNGDNYQPGAVIFPFPHDSKELIKMACGSEHVLCLFSSDEVDGQMEVWAWGWNEHDNLGIGTTEDQFIPVQVWPPSEGSSRRAVDIAAGNGTSWIVLE